MTVLINGNMNEANTRCAEIENVEVEDFIRFCEYAYRGDFTVPTWKQDETWSANEKIPKALPKSAPLPLSSEWPPPPGCPPGGPPRAEPLDDDWGTFGGTTKTKESKRFTKAVGLREAFENRIYQFDAESPKTKIQRKFNAYANDTSNQDFTPVFLAYARLYTFAHFRSIEPLKALTLQKLHSTLRVFKLYHNRVSDVIKLAEYAYTADDLPSRGEDGTIDSLRQLVVEYIACEIHTIGTCKEFVGFMEEGGEFMGDLWGIMKTSYVFLPI